MPNTAVDGRSPLTIPAKKIHVAVGVITNPANQVLIARRSGDVHQGGLWEFPGGKVESGESVEDALRRELREELDISATDISPLIKVHYDYPDKSVLLDVWRVSSFVGNPCGLQQQPLQWVPVSALQDYTFPLANRPIITALRLSPDMLITGDWENSAEFEHRLLRALDSGIRLVQLRAHHCAAPDYLQCCRQARRLCDVYGALLLANTSPELFEQSSAQGLHLTAQRLMTLQKRPVASPVLLGASCHNLEEIRQAEAIGADYITLGSVYPTTTHPGVPPLGVEHFSQLIQQTGLPVWALGGIDATRVGAVKNAGAFGIAAIRLWW